MKLVKGVPLFLQPLGATGLAASTEITASMEQQQNRLGDLEASVKQQFSVLEKVRAMKKESSIGSSALATSGIVVSESEKVCSFR